jgi:transposase-like protein
MKRSENGKGEAERRAAQAQRGSLGTPLASRDRGRALSVLSTCVTKQTRDMVYTMSEIEWLASFGPKHDDACMPWRESRIVDQRLQFLSSYQKEEMSITDLCHEYGVSRPTAYKWIKRYNELGPEGLLDQARKPHGCAHATSAEIENEILVLRKRFPTWGARKLKAD